MIDKNFTLLLIEDNADDADFIRETLKMTAFMDCRFHWEQRLADGKCCLDEKKIDLVLLDLSLPDSRGLDSVLSIRSHAPETALVVLTGLEDEEMGEKAIRAGAQDYLSKNDISAPLLENSLRYAVQRQQLVSRLKERRKELTRSEEQQKRIIEKTIDGILVVDRQERIRLMNKAAETLWGRTSSELAGNHFGYPLLSQPTVELSLLRKSKGKNQSDEIFADMQLVDIQWEGEAAWLVLLRDITWRKQMEQALLAEKERLEVTLRSIADGVIATDKTGKVVLINPVVEQWLGCSQEKAHGRAVAGILDLRTNTRRVQLKDALEQVLKTGEIIKNTGKTSLTTHDGKTLSIEYSCAPIQARQKEMIGTVLVIHDITHREKMAAELEKAQKLESLGVLAGGLAHRYNNVLTGILGDLSLSKQETDKGNRIYNLLVEAEQGTLRLKELTHRLMTFSQGGVLRKTPGSLPDLLREITGYMDKDNAAKIKYRWKIPRQVWPLWFDKDQLNLAIRNILQNARESMPAEGTITLSLENITVRDKPPFPLQKGNYVKVTIADRGIGIAEDHLQKIFDPYFTTKKENAGMGLTIAYSIIKKHGGGIDVGSRVGKGSAFSLFLPVERWAAQAPPSPTVKEMKEDILQQAPAAEHQGVALLMDDEEAVRLVAGEMLETLGYKTLRAADGQEALQLYRQGLESGEFIDVVILDLLVAGAMGGKECARNLRQLDPTATIVVSSGYSADPVIPRYRRCGFDAVLLKPYNIKELSDLLKKILKKGKK